MQGRCVVSFLVGFTSKHLCCGSHRGVFAHRSILGKDGCAGETKHHISFERAAYLLLHIAKLRAVTFVEDDDGFLLHHLLQLFILAQYGGFHQVGQLLYGGNDDAAVFIL